MLCLNECGVGRRKEQGAHDPPKDFTGAAPIRLRYEAGEITRKSIIAQESKGRNNLCVPFIIGFLDAAPAKSRTGNRNSLLPLLSLTEVLSKRVD